MVKKIIRYSLSFLLLTISVFSHAQTDSIARIYGVIIDKATEKPIKDALVEVAVDDHVVLTIQTDKDGKYNFHISKNEQVSIRFSSRKYVSKLVEISFVGSPAYGGGYEMMIELRLFRRLRGVDYSEFEMTPIGKAFYNPVMNAIAWDTEYIERVQKKYEYLSPETSKKK